FCDDIHREEGIAQKFARALHGWVLLATNRKGWHDSSSLFLSLMASEGDFSYRSGTGQVFKFIASATKSAPRGIPPPIGYGGFEADSRRMRTHKSLLMCHRVGGVN